jgi:catechol 2,3-dioxygenase-like lactoylglutathione lyase family enzyme
MEDSDMDNNPSILSHVSIGTNDFERAIAFYDAVLSTLGCKRLMEYSGAIAYGKQYPEFWVGTPFDGERATVNYFPSFNRSALPRMGDLGG